MHHNYAESLSPWPTASLKCKKNIDKEPVFLTIHATILKGKKYIFNFKIDCHTEVDTAPRKLKVDE